MGGRARTGPASVSDADFAQLKKEREKEREGRKKKLPFEKGNTLRALKERKI